MSEMLIDALSAWNLAIERCAKVAAESGDRTAAQRIREMRFCHEEPNKWREAVIEHLIVNCIYKAEHQHDPYLAVRELIAWEQAVALDPAVSSEAAALVARGRREVLRGALQGWTIEPLKGQSWLTYVVRTPEPKGYRAVVSSIDSNPANVLFMLADTLYEAAQGGVEIAGGREPDSPAAAPEAPAPASPPPGWREALREIRANLDPGGTSQSSRDFMQEHGGALLDRVEERLEALGPPAAPSKYPYVYKVTRWVREEFEVGSQTPLTLEQAIARANDPATVTVEREIAQQVKP